MKKKILEKTAENIEDTKVEIRSCKLKGYPK
jgi:hypothetical protein